MTFAIAIPFVCGIILFVNKKKLKFSLVNYRNIYSKKGKFPICLKIENKSLMPFSSVKIEIEFFNSIIKEKSHLTVNTPILPNNTQTLQLDFSSDHCGILSISISKIKVYDFLHIFTSKISSKNTLANSQHQEILITPEIIDLNLDIGTASNVDYESNVFSKNLKGDDPSEIFDLHEYRDGDKINRIHWKLTAKQGVIFVKDYSLPINNSINLIIGTRKNPQCNLEENLKIFDSCLEAAACISYSLSEKEIPFNLFYKVNSSNYLETDTIEDMDEFILSAEGILKSGFEEDTNYSVMSEALLENEAQKQYRYIYITTYVNDAELFDLAMDINAANTTVILIVSPKMMDQNFYSKEFENIEIIPIMSDELLNSLQQLNI